MKNLAIALNDGTPEKRNDLTRLLASNSWAYWHWVDDFWIVQVPDDYTAHSLHDLVKESSEVGTSTILVFEFKGEIQYWGRNKTEAWDWLKHIGNAG